MPAFSPSRMNSNRPASGLNGAERRDATPGDWLNASRARAYGGLLALAMVIALVGFYGKILAPCLSDAQARPLASDFDTFWAGARLALQGRPAAAYDPAAMRVAEQEGAQPQPGQFFAYLYPPVFLLLSLPLGALPYLVALPAFLLAGFVAASVALARILPRSWPWWPVLAFPAGLLNAVIGQNGDYSAACFAGALLWLENRPALAGACLGLLAFKPQLALCAPVALLAARRWRALLSCAAVAAALMAGAWLVLGRETWLAFLGAAPLARRMLQSPQIWPKMVSVASAARLLHGGAALAYCAQAASCAAAILVVAATSRRRPGAGAEMATLVTATMLCSPYLWDYDLVCLAVPLAWLAARATATGWRKLEKPVAAAAYLGPAVVRLINVGTGVPLAPLMIAALLAVVTRRIRAPLSAADAPCVTAV